MRRRLLAAIGACGIAATTLPAGPPPTPQALVAQLGSDHYPDREAAAKALEALGDAAAPALQAAAKSDDLTVRRTATSLLSKLDRAAESAKRLAPKTTSLSLKNVPLGSAVNTLKARTGLNLVLDPTRVADPMRPVTCEVGERPVWEVVEEFCKAAGVREVFSADLEVPKPSSAGKPRYYSPPPAPPLADAVPVTLADGAAAPLPGSRATAVRVVALPASYPGNRVILGAGETTINFDVTPAPGLGWNEVVGVRVKRVVDDAGRVGCAATPRDSSPSGDTDPFGGGMVFMGGARVAMRWDFDGNPIAPTSHPNPRAVPVPLKLATPDAKSLKLLEGVVVGEVTVANQQLISVDVASKQTGTPLTGPGGLKLTVHEVRPAANGATIVRVSLESPSAFAQRRRGFGMNLGWQEPIRPTQGNHIRSYDAAGALLTPISSGGTEVNDDGMSQTVTYNLTFRADKGAPAKLVVVGPKQVPVEVPFRMENVPLP